MTAEANGSAIITASATIGADTYTGTCSVTVSTVTAGDYIRGLPKLAMLSVVIMSLPANVSGTYYDLPKGFIADSMGGRAITVTSDSITNADATNYSVALSVSGTSIHIFDGSNYLLDTSSTSFGVSTSEPSSASWSLSTGTNGTFRLTGSTNNTRGFIYRASTYNVFGCYATSNASSSSTQYFDVDLFKKHVEESNVVTSLSATPTSKSYSIADILQARDFTVSVTKNGTAGPSADYTAKIGTGTGAGFSGSLISWGRPNPPGQYNKSNLKPNINDIWRFDISY